MKFTKAFLFLLLVLALIGAGMWQFLLKDQVALAKVATASTAKQICSCRFVAKREMDSCQTDFTQDISQLKITESHIDATGRADQSVTVSALAIVSATATYQPGLGCTLQK